MSVHYALRLSLLVGTLCSRPVDGQVGGVVTEDSGRPIGGALVEVWNSSARLGSAVTDGVGVFRFSASTVTGPTAIFVRAVGYGWFRASVASGDTMLRVSLHPLASQLAPVHVTGNASLCPNRDDPRARALWGAMAARYDPTPWAGVVEDTVFLESRIVGEPDIGSFDSTLLVRGVMGRTSDKGVDERIRERGYAEPAGLADFRTEYWSYVWLESLHANHFADTLFARLHRLSVLGVEHGQTTLVFCPTRRGQPEIEGTLTIAVDTSLLQAAWRFLTPRHDEAAGGRVAFAPPVSGVDVSRRSPLLPITGLFYRRRVSGFYQLWVEHRCWVLSGGTSASCGGRS